MWLTALDIAINNWIVLVSNSPELKLTVWAAWLISLSVVIAIASAAYYFWFLKKKQKFVFLIVLSSMAALAFTEVLKRIVLRPRPDASDMLSFPSQHTTLAFLLACLLIMQNPKSKVSWFLLILWAAAVAFSRLWLEQHFFTDVVAGALIGIVFAVIFARQFHIGRK